MRNRRGLFLFSVGLLLCTSACGGPEWEPLTDQEFTRYGEPLESSLASYVAAQRGYFAEHERYARHQELESPPTVRGVGGRAEDYVPDGFAAFAYNDSIPQLICGVFVGTAEPPLSVEMEAGVPVCQRETSILVCEEGHAYPATPGFNFCPMHGHALVEVVLGR